MINLICRLGNAKYSCSDEIGMLVVHDAEVRRSSLCVSDSATDLRAAGGSCRSGKVGIPVALDYKLCFLMLSATGGVALIALGR